MPIVDIYNYNARYRWEIMMLIYTINLLIMPYVLLYLIIRLVIAITFDIFCYFNIKFKCIRIKMSKYNLLERVDISCIIALNVYAWLNSWIIGSPVFTLINLIRFVFGCLHVYLDYIRDRYNEDSEVNISRIYGTRYMKIKIDKNTEVIPAV